VIVDHSRYRLAARDVVIEIDARAGARVVEFSLAGRNVLTTSAVHTESYGSTFWPSPQSLWGWPPPPELDAKPYRATTDGDSVVFEGAPDRALGIAVTKYFRMSPDGVVTIVYTMTNHGRTHVAAAPWEVTRVAHEGVTFFPFAARIEPPGARPAPDHIAAHGLLWVQHAADVPEDQKLYANGSRGWMAHATPHGLFVKVFPVIAPAVAPGEGEVEIFVNQSPPYVELEQQGAFASLAPGRPVTWTVEWHLVPLPAGTPLNVGEPMLVHTVEGILGAARRKRTSRPTALP
jgi:hypothetical protein